MTRLVNTIISIIEALLLLRLALQLFGANSLSPFVAWVYGVTNGLAQPFLGAFPVLYLGNNSVLNLSIVLAMICYAILGWLIVLLLSFLPPAFSW
jgi:hypothetical protein